MSMSTDHVIETLTHAGGRLWQNYGHRRIYFTTTQGYELTGGQIEFDEFGNVVFASLGDEAIPNNDADVERLYFDINTMTTVIDCENEYVVEAITEAIEDLIAQD